VYADDIVLTLGVSAIVSPIGEFEVFAAEPVLFKLLPLVEEVRPDVILLHVTAEMTIGFFAILRNAAPGARLILWGNSFSEELRYQARQIGVAGFLFRGLTQEEFTRNLTGIARGGKSAALETPDRATTVSLTARESQLVNLLAQGLRNKEIASCLNIAEGTVRIYLSRLFAKIGARDRFETAVFGLKNAYCGQASWDGKNAFVTEQDEDRARPVLKALVLVEPERRRGYGRLIAASRE
jgi:DNA-binding NarL/FixJ family response regulator